MALALLGTIAAGGAHAAELKNVLNGRRGFVIEGTEPNTATGITVANAGDVNGDGLDDVLVGEEGGFTSPFGATIGRCYVVFGKTNNARVSLEDIRSGVGGFVIRAAEFHDAFGWAIAGAGDVNGDGLDDVLISAAQSNPLGRFRAGTVYVVFGKTDTAAVVASDLAAGIGGYPIFGAETEDYAGWTLAGAGDVNGDGRGDILLTAPKSPTNSVHATTAYVIFGKADTAPQDLADILSESFGFIFRGDTNRVAGVGDVNSDGFDDVAATEYSNNRVAVVFGRTIPDDIDTENLFGEGDGFLITGTPNLGLTPSAAGDVNNDGVDDILIGSPGTRAPAGMVGSAYVLFGRTEPSNISLSANAISGTQGFIVRGAKDMSYFGSSVAAAGDQNSDGFDDVLIGAHQSTFMFDQKDWDTAEGATYLVLGKSTTSTITANDLAAGTGGYEIAGVGVREYSGRVVSGGGDINGDGRPDTIIGAPGATPHGLRDAGSVYVFFGGFPAYADADADTLSDTEETDTGIYASRWDIGSEPGIADSDNDRFTDGDGIPDGVETGLGTDPNDPLDFPEGLRLNWMWLVVAMATGTIWIATQRHRRKVSDRIRF